MIKKIILIAVNALLFIAFIICLSLTSSIKSSLRSQQAAETWRGQSGERFAQLSVFFPDTAAFTSESVLLFRRSLDTALVNASIDTPQGRILYTDAWSAEYTVSLVDSRGFPVSANATAIGGDFFLFHPYFLKSGSYLSPNDVMHDRVILDEELAWRLFGSSNLEGFEVLINARPFQVAGVISRESDTASTKAYTAGAGLFMTLEALAELTETEINITCYEIVMPNPITGFALKTMTDQIPSTDVKIIENSARYSMSNSFEIIRSFGERSMRTYPITYPYWENAARYTEDWLALILILSFLFITFPAICGLVYLIKLIRLGVKQGKKIFTKQVEKHDKRQYEKYLLKNTDNLDKDFELYDLDNIINEVKTEQGDGSSA